METVLVTGASSGIGRELAKRFAADGSRLVLVARREDRLNALAQELREQYSSECLVLPCDLSEPAAPIDLCDRIAELGVEVDVLVNNAGIGQHGPFVNQAPERLAEMVQVNASATTLLMRLLLPGMIARGRGGVLNISSTASFQPGPYMAVYYATKAHLRMLSVALSHEMRHEPLTITCLCPGPTLTEFGEEAGVSSTNLFRLALPVERVADAGHRAFRRGKRLAIPGLLNRLIVFGSWVMPRWIVLGVVARLHRVRKEEV